jgi:protein TonB
MRPQCQRATNVPPAARQFVARFSSASTARGVASILTSIAIHAVALTLVIIPLMYVTDQLPEVPDMMAFIAPALTPMTPPPAPAPRTPSLVAKRVPTSGNFAAPAEAPARIEAEPLSSAMDEGVPGGVEGDALAGVIGGVVGMSEPPPPPPPPAPHVPVRVGGGQLHVPTLLRRVEPDYPPLASTAHIHGVVMLETIVNETGTVESVTVLRSAHPLLDRAAIDAVKQWQYSPLLLNGAPTPFVLTVVLTFNLT